VTPLTPAASCSGKRPEGVVPDAVAAGDVAADGVAEVVAADELNDVAVGKDEPADGKTSRAGGSRSGVTIVTPDRGT
jgi:hypothetical protein